MYMKQSLKNSIHGIEALTGAFLGRVGRYSPPVSLKLYRLFVFLNRRLPDRLMLWLEPFSSALGDALFDLSIPVPETARLRGVGMMRLDLSEKTQRQIFSHKCFEAGLSRYIGSVLRPGDTFVDVGANVGYFTLLSASLVGNKGAVLAIEPEEKNFASLGDNVTANAYTNTLLCRCAAGVEEKEEILNVNPLNRCGNSMLPFDTYASGETRFSKEEMIARFGEKELFERVGMRTLDGLFDEYGLGDVAMMKIDVEGFELAVLQGCLVRLARGSIRRIVCEVNNSATRRDVFSLFQRYGYAPYRLSFAGKPERLPADTPLERIQGNVLFAQTPEHTL